MKSIRTDFWRLTLDTNPEDCNASCIMCEEHSPLSTYINDNYKNWGVKRRRMPEAWLEKIFYQANKIGIKEVIPSTMGEPLIYPHFEKIIDLCRLYNFKLNLTTNASFPRKSVEKWAELIIPIASDVKLSWNGALPQTYESIMKGLRFSETIEKISTFIRIRNDKASQGGNYCRTTLQLTFLTDTLDELLDTIKLAARLDIDRVKGHHLWAHWDEIKSQGVKSTKEGVDRWNKLLAEIRRVVEIHKRPNGNKVLIEGFYPLSFEDSFSNKVPEDWECPFLGKELWIAPDGRINPCCAPDQARQTLGFFGQLPDNSLEEVAESESYQNLIDNYKNHAVCKSCNMRKPIGK